MSNRVYGGQGQQPDGGQGQQPHGDSAAAFSVQPLTVSLFAWLKAEEQHQDWQPGGLVQLSLESGVKGPEKLLLGTWLPEGQRRGGGGLDHWRKASGQAAPNTQAPPSSSCSRAGSGSFEVMHGAVCLVFPAPKNRKQLEAQEGAALGRFPA